MSKIQNFFWLSPPSSVTVRLRHAIYHGRKVGLPMYRVSESVRSTHGQDGAIVLDVRQGQMFNLNFVGSRILQLLKGGSAQPEIVNAIVQEFGVSRDRAESDLQEFLKTLKKNHLVEEHGPGVAA